MNGSTKIQPSHKQRQGVVYLRQSSPKQVLKNCESAINQRSLRNRLFELGWRKDQIVLIDDDQGQSGKHAAGREGFQRLVADVSLRKVGIIIGTEVSRLSRNCADWHRLLELCALFDTLIADADGIYNPRDFNDRLLLGLKGTLSEAELHSIRLRLDAGRLSKAGRGELVQHLPSGLVRDVDDTVQFDSDQSIRDRIRLVFAKFQELGSAKRYFAIWRRMGSSSPVGRPRASMPDRCSGRSLTRMRCCRSSRTLHTPARSPMAGASWTPHDRSLADRRRGGSASRESDGRSWSRTSTRRTLRGKNTSGF